MKHQLTQQRLTDRHLSARHVAAAQSAAALRVFLADDNSIVLDGLKALVAGDAGLEVVGEASDGPSLLARAIEARPDVAVLDLSMPGVNAIDITRKLLAACPDCRLLVLTLHEDSGYLRQVLTLGVAGYILKRSAAQELLRGIHAVASGGLYLDPAIAGRAISAAPQLRGREDGSAVADLSTREIEVLRLAAVGHSNKTIAAKLQIGAKSVETYKARGMAKLGFQNRVEVVRFALSMGWLADS
jgi:DNA-binding NarL/FixJ family response regulator